jgi:hypothetical protein
MSYPESAAVLKRFLPFFKIYVVIILGGALDNKIPFAVVGVLLSEFGLRRSCSMMAFSGMPI